MSLDGITKHEHLITVGLFVEMFRNISLPQGREILSGGVQLRQRTSGRTDGRPAF